MQSNVQLKLAVISALSAYAFSTSGSAFALGLGDIDVKSHLGQPLRATVKVQGINDIKAADLKGNGCFRLVSDSNLENALTTANFKLSKVVNDEATLSITTRQTINEPITSMSLVASCDANIRRDYTLLLDPPSVVVTKNSDDEESTMISESPLKTTVSSDASTEKTAPQAIQTSKYAGKMSKAKLSSAKKTNKNILLTTGFNAKKVADENASPSIVPNAPKTTTKTYTPRLSISSDDALISNALETPNLVLDKQLHLSPETSPEAYAPEIAIQDEVTVMNNRLAHLQKQINSLQQRNMTVETENKLKAQQLEQEKTTGNHWQWLGYLYGAGLMVGGYFAADWWWRRRQTKQLELTEATWIEADHQDVETAFPFEIANANDDFFENLTANTSLNSTQSPSNSFVEQPEKHITVEEFSADQNILDHADVFLSHGRTSLAIQLLQNHLLDYPKQSVTIWLFLLDLLAKENMQAAYEQMTLECKEHFNIRIAGFTNDEASEKTSFEDFPRLYAGLQAVWATPEALVFLDDLIYNSRLENRIGFEKSVIEELLLLKNVANETINTAKVIQIDEKKLLMKERKEAQLAAKKVEKIQQMNTLALTEQSKLVAANIDNEPEEFFEFNLVEYN